MSRIESNLLSKIENSSSALERAVLSSRLAVYYFHKGDSRRAMRLVEELRAWSMVNDGLDVMVYINLAEATDFFQSAQTEGAIKKARRAYALSFASGKQNLIALSAIWMAHILFNNGQYADAVSMIGTSLKNIHQSEALAKTRCYVMIADLLGFCGRSIEANPWYFKARAAAVEEGDEIAIGQIIYNSAVFRFNNVRLAQVRGLPIEEELRLLELMISSSSNYDVGVNSSAFKSLLPMLNAQLLMLREDYVESSRTFAQWLQFSDASVDARIITLCRADFALSLAITGLLDQAIEQFRLIDERDESTLPPDEAAIINHQRSRIYSIVGDNAMAERHSGIARSMLQEHEHIQNEILSRLLKEIAFNSSGS